MLSGLRTYFRGVVEVGREVRTLREEQATIRREWDEELSEMRGMWDKLQLWAARQAKRDKAIAKTGVELLTGGDNAAEAPASGIVPVTPAQMTKDELRRYAQQLKVNQ